MHRKIISLISCLFSIVVVSISLAAPSVVLADESESVLFFAKHKLYEDWFDRDIPDYLYDRGTGMTTSLFGTYVRKGEFLFYPFYEYEREEHEEYNPDDFGIDNDQDYPGTADLHQFLLFATYGLTDNLLIELEWSAQEKQSIHRASQDTGPGQRTFSESGSGAFETQLRWRMFKETRLTPELFSYFETVFPLQRDRMLIGQSEWELVYGLGLVKGFKWGTITVRGSVTHEPEIDHTEFGEYAIEYLKRFGDDFRWVMTLEGSKKELSSIFELQWYFHKQAFLKLNTGIGLTREAVDYAPEIGIMFRF